MNKLFTLSFIALAFLFIFAPLVSAVSTYMYWPDNSITVKSFPTNQDVEFNYVVFAPSTNNVEITIKLIENNDFANPLATLVSASGQGTITNAVTVDNGLTTQGNTYSLYALVKDTTSGYNAYNLLDFVVGPKNTAPEWDANLQLFYRYNVNLVNVNVVDFTSFASDVDGDPLTFSLDQTNTNFGVVDCSLTGAATSQLNCDLNGIGTTTLDAIVSDGVGTDRVTLTIEVYNQTGNNTDPEWNNTLQLTYVYDINAVNNPETLVDLSLYGIDVDGDPLTYSIDTTATNTNIAFCGLSSGSVLRCTINGVGTTGLNAVVSDGQGQATVQITIIVLNGSNNNPPYFVNINPVTLTRTGSQFIFDLPANSRDPDNDPTTNGFRLTGTDPTVINFCAIVAGDLYCNAVGAGTTFVEISVSDGQFTTWDRIPITVDLGPNSPPVWDSSLQVVYTYDVSLGNVDVNELLNFASDPDGDQITFALDESATDLSIVDCQLRQGRMSGLNSLLNCDLNGVGTTTLSVGVSDGEYTTWVQFTFIITQQGPQVPVAIISRPGTDVNCDADTIFFDGMTSFSPEGNPLVSYSWVVLDLRGNVVLSASGAQFSAPALGKGRFDVYLTVVDNKSLVGTAWKRIHVCNEANTDFTDTNEEGLRVDTEIWGFDFEKAYVGSQIEVIAVVENYGVYDIDDLRMTFTIPEYGFKWRSSQHDIDKGDQTTISMVVDLPFDLEPGVYYPTVSFSDDELRRVKPHVLEVRE